MSKTYLSNDAYGWRVIHQGMPLTVDKKTSQAAIDAAIKAYPEIKIENQYWDGIAGEFVPVSHLQKLKNNPAKRRTAAKRAPSARKGLTAKRYVSRPSQATHKAPTKRLVARRKAAAKKPVKGYFPNPKDRELFIVKVTLSDEVMRQTKAPEAARNFVQIYRTQTAAIKNAKANAVLGTVSVTKMCESEMRDAAFMKLIGN